MKWVIVQVYEVIDGVLTPIDHKANKDVREGGQMANDLARVKHGMGITLNLGDYQSARVDVGIELPCKVEDKDKAFEEAATFSNDKLMEEVATLYELKKAMGGK